MSPRIQRIFFLSFEDALWNFLRAKSIPKGAIILVPDFYCMDVVENMRSHGYTPVMYSLDDHFQISQYKLTQLVKQYRPAVVILFHACGIQNNITKTKSNIITLCDQTIVLEDAVHLLVNPSDIQIYHNNHFVIDSLRKVSPLSGSFIYGARDALVFRPTAPWKNLRYIFGAHIFYTFFRLAFFLGVICNAPKIVMWAHAYILKKHDDLIGDSIDGYAGIFYIPFIHRFINFQKVEKQKSIQADRYASALASLYTGKKKWYEINMTAEDKKSLHVYPVGYRHLHKKAVQSITNFLHTHRVPVWFKFFDSPWSARRSVLFLPLGFHVSSKEIDDVTKLLSHVKE